MSRPIPSFEHISPLDAWIEQAQLESFVNDLKSHMNMWAVEDPDGLIRLIMISIRAWFNSSKKLSEKE